VGALATPTEAERRARGLGQEGEGFEPSVSTTHVATATGVKAAKNHPSIDAAAAPQRQARGSSPSPMKPPIAPASSSSSSQAAAGAAAAGAGAGAAAGARGGGSGGGSSSRAGGGGGGDGGEFSAAGARMNFGYLQPSGASGLKPSSSCPEVGRCTSCEFSRPTSLKPPGFIQPSNLDYEVKTWFQTLPFYVQLVPLRRGGAAGTARRGGAVQVECRQLTHKLETAWFQPLHLKSGKKLVSSLCFFKLSTCAATRRRRWRRRRRRRPSGAGGSGGAVHVDPP
jgi:hypothetical protein